MIFYIRHMSELLILAFKKAINIHYIKKCTKRTDNNTLGEEEGAVLFL